MRAEVALGGRAILGIHVNRIVRTSLHASLATDAALGIEIDDPVATLVHRGHGANGDARRLLAVVAARDLKDAARVGKDALLDVFDPGPVDSDRNLIFGLARHGAGVTANAFAIIDYEAVFHPRK
jgi:hypothetical protein